MKATPIIIALALLGAIPLQVGAQEAPTQPAPAPAPAPTDDLGTSGTGTGTDSVGSSGTGTGTDSVGSSGTGTGTDSVGSSGTGTGTDSVGNTGTGTGTNSAAMTSAPLTISLSAQYSSMSSNRSQPITVLAVLGSDSAEVTSGTETIPLSSSNSACKVPVSVDLAWNSTVGGMTTFQVTCSKISGKARTVTITGGSASTSFTLKP